MKNNTHITRKLGSFGLTGILALGILDAKAEEPGIKTNNTSETAPRVEQEKLSLMPRNLSTDTGWHSRYMGTYGFTISDRPVVQSDISFDLGKFSYNLFGNYDTSQGLSELDNSITLNLETKHFKIKPDFYWFSFPSLSLKDAFTFGVGVQTKNLPMDMSLYGVQSLGEVSHSGELFQLRLSKTFSLTKRISLEPETRFTYNHRYFVPECGISTATAGLNVGVDFGKSYSMNFGIRAQKAIDTMHGVFKDHAGTFDISIKKKW